jgi:HAD superfamily hydrolase (TIGR01484 family)
MDSDMKYKALFLDVDGTILPYKKFEQSAVPSPRVVKAIRNASKHVHVVLATGRPYFMLEKLIQAIGMTEGLLVMNDGAQVMDIKTKKYHYQKAMLKKDVEKISQILSENGISFFLNDGIQDSTYEKTPPTRSILNIFTMHKMTEKQAIQALNLITHLPTIKANMTHFGSGETYELLISHAEATKMHGIIAASKVLGVKKEETIAVGDSGNDFPLLMAAGLKVAMGNAMEGLKDIADYVAPGVEEDGVAHVINKFILHESKK